MSLTPPNTSKHLLTSLLVIATIIVILLPFPTSAMPIALPQPTPSSESSSSNPSPMNAKVIFDIVFGLVLFLFTIGAFVWVAFSTSFTRFNGVLDRACAAFATLKQHLSPFRLTAFFAQAGNAIAGVNDANVSFTRNQSGGGIRIAPPVYYPATVQGGVGRSWVPVPSNTISAHDPDPQTGYTTSV